MGMIVGPVKVKLNGKFFITCENFSWDRNMPTRLHFGGYGYFGTSQGQAGYTGSFDNPFPVSGPEFDFDKEFANSTGTIQLSDAGLKLGFENCALAGSGGRINQERGETVGTVKWTGIGVGL